MSDLKCKCIEIFTIENYSQASASKQCFLFYSNSLFHLFFLQRQSMSQHSNLYSGQVQQHTQNSYYSSTQSPSSALQQVKALPPKKSMFMHGLWS